MTHLEYFKTKILEDLEKCPQIEKAFTEWKNNELTFMFVCDDLVVIDQMDKVIPSGYILNISRGEKYVFALSYPMITQRTKAWAFAHALED